MASRKQNVGNSSMSPLDSENRIAHLGMIQGVINRLASNSTSMKSMSGTIGAAAIALYGAISQSHCAYFLGASLAIFIFWILDAKYLHIEHCYRALYNHVRNDRGEVNFGMDYKSFVSIVPSVRQLLFSWSLIWFYGAILIVFLTIEISMNITFAPN